MHNEGFFTAAIRSRIVQFILDRNRFSDEPLDDNSFGIDRLVIEETYLAAYPLHDVSFSRVIQDFPRLSRIFKII